MSRQATVITLIVVFLVSVGTVGGYLLYAIPSSNADRLDHQLSSLRKEQSSLAAQLAAANRRADAADERASASRTQAAGAYARGHAQGVKDGLQDGLSQAQSKYDQGYADGSASVFGRLGGNWAEGGFYVVRVAGGHVVTRAALQQCLAVYAEGGSVWIQGPAC